MLFKNYPEIDYIIKNKSIKLVDIFKNIAFLNTDASKAFLEYYIQDGETPEILSAKFYGDTDLSWLILLSNNIADLKKEWYSDSATYLRDFNRDYGGTAYYIAALPDIQPGDVMVRVGSTGDTGAITILENNYIVIESFDPKFRVIRGTTGPCGFDVDHTVLFARHDPSNGTVKPIEFYNNEATPKLVNYTNLYFLEPYARTIDYFYNSNNVVIDPYKKTSNYRSGIKTDTIYLDETDTTTENNFANTILFSYISNNGSTTQITGIFKREIQTSIYEEYRKKQKIKILKPEYVASVLNAIKVALNDDAVGRIYRIDL